MVAPTVALAAVAAEAASEAARRVTLSLEVDGAPLDGSLDLCCAALGDLWCAPLRARDHAAHIDLPHWVAQLRVGVWLSETGNGDGDRLGAHAVDLKLGEPRPTSTKLLVRFPEAGAVLAGPVLPQLEVDARAETIDGREVRACYAVLDRRCCVLLWTEPGPLRAQDDLARVDTAPVFDALHLPPGHHELVAWLERGASTLVALSTVRFAVAPPPSPGLPS